MEFIDPLETRNGGAPPGIARQIYYIAAVFSQRINQSRQRIVHPRHCQILLLCTHSARCLTLWKSFIYGIPRNSVLAGAGANLYFRFEAWGLKKVQISSQFILAW